MSDKIEQAAEEIANICYETEIKNNTKFGAFVRGFYRGSNHREQQLQSTITTLQAENSRLKGALEKITQCDPKNAMIHNLKLMRDLATEALTPKE
jgi:hypothetical protein